MSTPKFKVGDKVRVKEECSGCKAGEVCELHDKAKIGDTAGLWAWYSDDHKYFSGCSCQDNWELVKSAPEPKKQPVKWNNTTPHQDEQITLEDGDRKAIIYFNEKNEFVRCQYWLDMPHQIETTTRSNTKEDWKFISRVANKIKTFK